MRIIWIIGGLVSLGLGILGIPLPLLPTVPFLLLAAFCFSRSSDQLHGWLLAHPTLGPPIHNWRQSGSISRSAKITSTAMIAASLGVALYWQISLIIVLVQMTVLVGVSYFIWSRPEA
ncbi:MULTISPECIES: YbaN family protein [Thalassobacter]|uniref:YbaN family protein n=1 Tax=Thalassobacter TaxID=266808 RepID=UPI0009E09B67|nr:MULTISPECIES: YbaN family protein [Thalassobacter]